MKFSEMQYNRVDVEKLKKEILDLAEKIKNATTADEQIKFYMQADKSLCTFSTMAQLAYIRHTINTKDEYYDKENEYMDEVGPQVSEAGNHINEAMLNSKFRPELEKELGALLFTNLEIAVRSFKPELVPLMQEENKLQSQYQKLYAAATVEWNGEQIPLPMLGPHKLSNDRNERKLAFVKEGEFFDNNRKELDEIYDKLIKNRNKQARILGHDNFIQLGYDRLGRNCYGYNDIKTFRQQIAEDIVPIVNKVKEGQKKRIGVDKIAYYDNNYMFPDGNAKPKGSADDILKAGFDMYSDMSEETAEFIRFMFDNELFDVLSKDGKAPGGYCTNIHDYKSPFIFSNFNGTSGDVDVLTHEAGHAFAAFRSMKQGYISDYISPTIEACEVHSMSMEFLTEPYHEKFFGEETAKYALYHCSDALNFIPYGCMVDEFQHIMYENEDLTCDDRNKIWAELEVKYRPYIDFENLPFYSRGAGWQRQLHIYLYPLYYIDYCMAQTVAFMFWLLSMKDRKEAWQKYMKFTDQGGTQTFAELVKSVGFKLPYEDGSIKEIAIEISNWIDLHQNI